MQKKVPRYRQKVQIFKSTDGTGPKMYCGTIVHGTAHLCRGPCPYLPPPLLVLRH